MLRFDFGWARKVERLKRTSHSHTLLFWEMLQQSILLASRLLNVPINLQWYCYVENDTFTVTRNRVVHKPIVWQRRMKLGWPEYHLDLWERAGLGLVGVSCGLPKSSCVVCCSYSFLIAYEKEARVSFDGIRLLLQKVAEVDKLEWRNHPLNLIGAKLSLLNFTLWLLFFERNSMTIHVSLLAFPIQI